MSKYKLIIFDLDGTLIDTSEGVILSFQYVFDKYNLSVPDGLSVNNFIGPPLLKTFGEYFNLTGDTLFSAIRDFREYYASGNIFKAKLYDKMDYVLQELKRQGYLLAVATNKNETHAHMVLEHFDIEKYFDSISGSNASETLEKKDIINTTLSKLSIANNQALMVGDASTDLVGARLSNVDFLAVTYGFGFLDEKSLIDNNIKHSIKMPIELLEFLSKK